MSPDPHDPAGTESGEPPDPAISGTAESSAAAGAAAASGLGARMGGSARRLVRSRIVAAGLGLAAVLGIGWQRCGIRGCPSVARLASYQPGGASVLLDRNGQRIADLGPADHAVVEIESLPAYVPAAFVAVEDKRFYGHDGVDWRRVVGAAWANVRAGRAAQGSSTITMQLSRNVFPDRIRAVDRTMRRKLLEVRVARDIERRFTKDEILELYLNHIYFGAGAYGIEAAARRYFGRGAKDISLEQAALLAALPRAPSLYDPRRNPERARSRRDLVLGLMAAQGRVGAARAERARSAPLRLAPARDRAVPTQRAAWFVQAVRELLEARLGEDLYDRRLRVHTTLDLRAQAAAEEELERQIRRVEAGAYGSFAGPRLAEHQAGSAQTEYLQGAVVVIENETGDVLALVGGRDARHSSFNRATSAKRQTGSAFKPFVYATALARGQSPAQWVEDSPYRLVTDGRAWEPDNYDGEFLGPLTLRDALVFSRNVPTIRLASDVGEKNIARLAKSAGIRGELRETPMIALGIVEASPLELAAAYTAFSGQGVAVAPRLVLRVEEADGKVRWQPGVESKRVLDTGVAWLMTDMLRDAVDRGTGRGVRSAGYRGLAAGKTGTTNDGADNWFVGYTPRVTAGVWVGFDRPREIAARASGGSVAAWAWGRLMSRIGTWAGGPPWSPPDRVVQVSVDPRSGLALEDGCAPREGEARDEYFLRGSMPDETCPERIGDGSGSWLGRVVAWAGDAFQRLGERRAVRIAGAGEDRRKPSDEWRVERRQETSREDSRGRPRFDDDRRDREAERRGGSQADWVEDLRRTLDAAMERRRDREERAVEWLEDLAGTLEGRLDGEAEAYVRQWLDTAIRSIDEATRTARRAERRRLELWLDDLAREIERGRLTGRQRRELEAELRRTASRLRAFDRELSLAPERR